MQQEDDEGEADMQADNDAEEGEAKSQGQCAAAAESSSSAAVSRRRSTRPKAKAPLLRDEFITAACERQSYEMRFSPLDEEAQTQWRVTSFMGDDAHLHYGDGDPIPVYELDGWHYVDFTLLYPRMIAAGLFPITPSSSRFVDDPAHTRLSALQLLYFFVDHSDLYRDRARLRDYLDLRDEDVVLVDGMPFVTVHAILRTLMQQPYLNDEQHKALEGHREELEEALAPTIETQLDYEYRVEYFRYKQKRRRF